MNPSGRSSRFGHLHLASGQTRLATSLVRIGKSDPRPSPQEDVAEVVEEHGLERRTPNTITDDQKLYDELQQIREQGMHSTTRKKYRVFEL
ncbi:hypothetical protein D8S78_23755 [Natrialba swarupiae]|nr:hypothetical protein [Natrialba swarupiae]